jgi:hypothetical protein
MYYVYAYTYVLIMDFDQGLSHAPYIKGELSYHNLRNKNPIFFSSVENI